MSDSNSVTFLASLPDIGSAFRVSGHRNGARITLEIPESEMAGALQLLAWRECVLKITVEPVEDDSGAIGRRAAKRRIVPGGAGM